MSEKSGRRLVFALLNAPRDFGVMATLTFRQRVMDGRVPLREFLSFMRNSPLCGTDYAWVREYQSRGAVHYHFLFERDRLAELGLISEDKLERVCRKGKVRWLVRGELEEWITRWWRASVGDYSDEFWSFQHGGIVELLADGDSAAKYFGSYLGKADQKTLPDDAEKSGRWWFVSPSAKPQIHSTGHLTAWHKPLPLNTVFDKQQLEEHYTLRQLEPVIPKHWRVRDWR